MVRLSYSKLNSYEMCQRQFYYSYIANYPQVQNKYLVEGSEIHNLLYLSTKEDDWKFFLLNHPKYQQYKEMIDNYVKYQEYISVNGGSITPEYAEYKMYDKDLDFSLVIDRIDSFDGKKVICDYKSDSKVDRSKHDKQLILYTYFYNKLKKSGEKEAEYFGPLFLKHDTKLKCKKISQQQIDDVLNWVKRLKKEIESKKNIEDFKPNINPFCKNCSHFLTGICKDFKKNDEITEMSESEMGGTL
jgi:hypothetical protein